MTKVPINLIVIRKGDMYASQATSEFDTDEISAAHTFEDYDGACNWLCFVYQNVPLTEFDIEYVGQAIAREDQEYQRYLEEMRS